jgi:hypothetical protein
VRLWSIHPRYLDPSGLVAVWREALLARAVLGGHTRGYRHHPQLIRFREHDDAERAIAAYLTAIFDESIARGYAFDRRKVARVLDTSPIVVTSGQMKFEWKHLRRKLALRSPKWRRTIHGIAVPDPHPLFIVVEGDIEQWEKRLRHSERRSA